MQVSSVTGLSISRLFAPVTAPRPTGAAAALRSAQETARTVPNALTRDQVRLSLHSPLLPDAAGPANTPVLSPTLNNARLETTRKGLIQSLRDRIQALSDRVTSLLDTGSFNTRQADVFPTGFLTVTPANETALGRSLFRSTRLSEGQTLASDPFPSGSSLGLSGTFLINGVSITVASTDGLSNIRDRINRGEDSNGNGVLDGPEDLNGNGAIDIIQLAASEAGPGLFVVEDVNGNGVLDPSEDANANNRLDGGTADNRVIAGLVQNRLILTSQTGGASEIALQDPDGVLLALGFFELNAKGLPIQKEAQFDFEPRIPTNLNTTPQTAQLEVDGKKLESDTNEFTDALENATVALKKSADRTIDVEIVFNAETALADIESLAQDFNAVVTELNQSLRDNQPFAQDADIQQVQQSLIREEPVKTNEGQSSAAEDVLKAFDRITPPVSGQALPDSGVLKFGDFFSSDTAQTIEQGVRPEPPTTAGLIRKQLEATGISVQEDNTLKINSTKLEQALKDQNTDVQNLFFDEEQGLLAFLQASLDSLLNQDLGPLGQPASPTGPSEDQQTDNSRLQERLIESLSETRQARTLIAIV